MRNRKTTRANGGRRELNARGMKKPAEPILDAVVERIAGNPLPAVRLLGEIAGQIGKGLYDLSRLFRQRD
jgi:hypothetical protein